MSLFSFGWPFAILLVLFFFLNEQRHYIDQKNTVAISMVLLGGIFIGFYMIYSNFFYEMDLHSEVVGWILFILYLIIKFLLRPSESFGIRAKQLCLHPDTMKVDKNAYRKRMQQKIGKSFTLKHEYRLWFKQSRYFVKKYKNVMNFVKDIRIQPLKYAEVEFLKRRTMETYQEKYSPVQNSVVNMVKQIYIDTNRLKRAEEIQKKYETLFSKNKILRYEVDKELIEDYKEALKYFSYPIGNLYLLAESVFDRELLGCLQNLRGTKLQPLGFAYFEIFRNERSIS